MPIGNLLQPICGSCLNNPPPFSYSVSAFDYQKPIKRLISDFKYYAKLHTGRVLAQQLIKKIKHFYQQQTLPNLIVPVPLHPSRIRQRGYNQAHEIAKYLAIELNINLDPHLCLRQKSTGALHNLSAKQRQQNLRQAFTLDKSQLANINSFSTIAIVDDVVTTMATTTEISRLLKEYGVNEVHIWSIARTCK